MKIKVFKITIVILFLLIIITGLLLYRQNEPIRIGEDKENPRYHFAAILENRSSGFTDDMERGIRDAAIEYNAVVEIKKAGKSNTKEEVSRFFDMSILSMVDGVILNATEQEEYIYKAVNERIPVANIENNRVVGSRIVNIGTDIYEVGARIGTFILSSKINDPKIAVMIPESEDVRYKNLIVSGIWSAIEKKKGEVVIVRNSKSGVLDAEEVALGIMDKYPEVNIIICTSIDNTLGTAQVILDTGRRGKVYVIGYDYSNEIAKHIDDGSVLATVYRNSYKMGYEAVESLVDIKERKTVTSNDDMEIEIISAENIDVYSIRGGKGGEHGK